MKLTLRNLENYMSDSVEYVITNKKWNKEFAEVNFKLIFKKILNLMINIYFKKEQKRKQKIENSKPRLVVGLCAS